MWYVILNLFTTIIDRKVFSLCRIDIKSQKANLISFEICIQNVQINYYQRLEYVKRGSMTTIVIYTS